MNRLVSLVSVAVALNLAPSYLRRIAADQGREPSARRYPKAIHERVPIFFKDGHSWVTTAATFSAHMNQRGKVWEREL